MAEQQLHHAQVGAMVEQVGGEGVTQSMRTQWRQLRLPRVACDQHPRHLPCQRLLATADKHRVTAMRAQD
ncbi:hypothetical protein D3C72_2358180 [compost metagenome]